jgi:hypothetical protein
MVTTKQAYYQMTMVDALKLIPRKISNGAFKILMMTPSTR